jgi:thiamine-monophosphate kinase
MKLSEIGEFGFIDRFSEKFSSLNQAEVSGIGDDCAIMPLDDNHEQIVTTDLLIEDIHFIRSAISPFDIGYKALAVNLSDIAAMGGKPTASFLSIALPSDTDVEFMDAVMDGYRALSEKYQVPLLGGDTTKSPEKIIINVCVTGRVKKNQAKLRTSAKENDYICVTGPLGDSGAGLKMLLENVKPDEASAQLIAWHNRPEPAINEGLWLGKQKGVHAMMDISDGVASDLQHILSKSGVGATIDVEKVPLSEELKETTEKNNWNALMLALTAGEDYRLLMTVSDVESADIIKQYNRIFSHPLTIVGRITNESPGKIKWLKNNRPYSLNKDGFNHFLG